MFVISRVIKKIGYSKIIPRGVLRFLDDLLLIPAMWLPGSLLREFFNRLRGVKTGKRVWIGQGCLLGQHPFLLSIGNNVIISGGVKILTHDTSFTILGGKDLAGEVKIGNNVHIGENAVIMPGVSIADNCIIGANALVNKDIASGSIAVGVPAKVVKTTNEGMRKLEEKINSGKYFSAWEA